MNHEKQKLGGCRFLLEMKSEVSINPRDFVGSSHALIDDLSTLQGTRTKKLISAMCFLMNLTFCCDCFFVFSVS